MGLVGQNTIKQSGKVFDIVTASTRECVFADMLTKVAGFHFQGGTEVCPIPLLVVPFQNNSGLAVHNTTDGAKSLLYKLATKAIWL